MTAPKHLAIGAVGAILLLASVLVQVGVVAASIGGCPTPNCVVQTAPVLTVGPTVTVSQSANSITLKDSSYVHRGYSVVPLSGWNVTWFNVTWGDGSSQVRQVPGSSLTHVYGSPGIYNVTEQAFAVGPTMSYLCGSSLNPATCRNTSSLSGSWSGRFTVPSGCVVNCGSLTTPAPSWSLVSAFTWRSGGLTAYFYAAIQNSNVTVLNQNVVWSWGDGTPSQTFASPSFPGNGTMVHTFPRSGTFEVTLRAAGVPFGGINNATPTAISTVTQAVYVASNATTTGSTAAAAPPAPLILNPLSLALAFAGIAILGLLLPGVWRVVVVLVFSSGLALVLLLIAIGVQF